MNSAHYIGFDVHKKSISLCVKTAAGEIVEEGVVAAQRPANPNSYFVERNRFPKMDVWPGCRLGRANGSLAVVEFYRPSRASRALLRRAIMQSTIHLGKSVARAMPLFLVKKLLIAVALFLTVTGATAQTVTTLYSFKINGISAYPEYVALAQGRDGKFYGTTSGSTTDYGSVFTSGTEGGFDNLLSMDGTEGVSPYGGLTMGSDGNFYGTTSFGGTSNSGVFFRITPAGVYTVLHEFNGVSDGSVPIGPPIQASDGNFYGSTEGQSTIYEYMPSGSFSTIYQFTGTTGLNPFDSLTEGNDGNLYGTAHAGGASGCGTIFKISKAGKMLWYYSFPCGVGGLAPVASLIQASDGNFYGTTDSGGAYGSGTIFKMTPKGSVTILYSFGAIALDGSAPDGGLIQGTDGNLYGVTTLGGAGKVGTAYKITTAGVYSQLYSFTRSFGYYPLGRLTQHTDGQFYGTTNEGGADKAGIVYMLNMNLAPFVTFGRPTGAIGQTAQVLGQGLTGTTAVSFNGVTASSFNVFSDTYITAVVPNGATTGAVTVTTPNGELTSNRSFQVLSSTGAYSRRKPIHSKSLILKEQSVP